jgi:hypothetical protein
MPKQVTMTASRTYPVPIETAFDAILPAPLEQVFARGYGPIPAIRGTEQVQPGPWGQNGYVRTIRMADGGAVREELTRVDRPTAFGYTLSEVSGPMKFLASRVQGLWTFEPEDGGTRVTWEWIVHPASTFSAPLLPIFAMLWRQFAKRSLENIAGLMPAT